MDYDLRRLGAVQFEQMIQALVVAEHGPNVEIFGKGRDGGRDAIIRRLSVANPSTGHSEVGAAVVQAKFVDVPDTDPKEGFARFMKAVRTEMRSWTKRDEKSDSAKAGPPYILFATNAAMSPARESGGFDQFHKEFALLREETDFRAVELWHYTHICSLLDVHVGIRDAYFAAIAPGGLIAQMHAFMEESSRSISDALWTSLSIDVSDERFMTVVETELDEDRQLKLTEVFTDLPFSPGRSKVHGALVSEFDQVNSRRRIVLVGGPGQGKTTISRFLAQSYRSELLRTLPEDQLSVKLAAIIHELEDCIERDSLARPALRRWPFRVVLSEYALEIGRSIRRTPAGTPATLPSLLEFLASEISKQSQRAITASSLEVWLRRWPSLVILDGMDETPVDLRAELVNQISHFDRFVAIAGIDAGIVVTTRPQANGTDLDPEEFEHWSLGPLGDGARGYAERLLELRYGHSRKQHREVLGRLDHAIEDSQTKNLFTTPLQVAILTSLLRHDRIPQSRFELFDRYFDTLYRREGGKPGDLGQLVKKERTVIESVHRRIALLLQIRSERSGQDQSQLTEAELEKVVLGVLSETGASKSRDRRAKAILSATTDRLVFLVSKTQGLWEFEVRSLQEYMAARALTGGEFDEETGKQLLMVTASSTYWRNVWLLAAGSAFSISLGYRNAIIAIASTLNMSTPLMRWVQPAAPLAIDMLADSVAASYPAFERTLVSIALRPGLLDKASVSRLATFLFQRHDDPELGDAVRDDLKLIASDVRAFSAVAPVLMQLANGRGPMRTFATGLIKVAPRSAWWTPAGGSGASTLRRFCAEARSLPDTSQQFLDQLSSLEQAIQAIDDAAVGEGSTSHTRQILATHELSRRLSDPSTAQTLAMALSRLRADSSNQLGDFLSLLSAAEAIRDRSITLRESLGSYLIVGETD